MPDYDARCRLLEDELADAKERIHQLEAELGVEEPAPLQFGLTGSEARVLGVLQKRPFVTKSMVMHALYAARGDGDDVPEAKIADVLICKLRAKLKPFEIEIEIETVWGQGWCMSAEMKGALRKMG